MSREQLVVLARRQQREIRPRQLQPHHQCFDPAEGEKHERRDDVPDADLFVIDGAEEAPDAGLGLPKLLQLRLVFEAADADLGSGHLGHHCSVSK